MDTDHAAITALVHGYAERIDAGDLDGIGALFADGVYRSERGGRYEGAEAVAAVLRNLVKLHDDGTPRTKHVTTNLIVEADGGSRVQLPWQRPAYFWQARVPRKQRCRLK
jgi:hypothetical protein